MRKTADAVVIGAGIISTMPSLTVGFQKTLFESEGLGFIPRCFHPRPRRHDLHVRCHA